MVGSTIYESDVRNVLNLLRVLASVRNMLAAVHAAVGCAAGLSTGRSLASALGAVYDS
jgi:hypothetical protein